MLIRRSLPLLLALVVCAWFAVGIRQAIDMSQASRLITGSTPVAPAAARHAATLLNAAAWLNPDRTVDILRGELALGQRDPGRAQNILEAVARAEPMNLEAWVWLANSALHRDPRELALAVEHIRRLDRIHN